jgi:hypothetical protein
MRTLDLALVLVACGGAVLVGCKTQPKAQKSEKALGPGSARCAIDPARPGPLRRGGRAQVQLRGGALAIDLKDVPALCGPMFNTDVSVLDIVAGQGLQYETCLPNGTLQITAWERKAGPQELHKGTGGAEVLFNMNRGATYTSQGAPEDSVVVSDDFWRVEAKVTLKEVVGTHTVKGNIVFDCTEGTTAPAP